MAIVVVSCRFYSDITCIINFATLWCIVTISSSFYVSRYIFRNAQKVGIQELGPRFTLKLRSLQRGTFDSKYGEYIWIHKVGGGCGVLEV